MPICKKCNNKFPFQIEIDGKVKNLQNRKYCLTCSPFGYHNTKALEKLDDDGKKQAVACICETCGNDYLYLRSAGGTKTECGGCSTTRRRRVLKAKCLEYLGGKCQHCGYDKCNAALSFHHRDPSTKLFSISSGLCRSWESIQLELDKCDLLCANCHAEQHAEEDQ